ncbi:MAG: hypothetical protein Q8M94_15660, partial [Ignavibacteria bacterium]|nr:hypothetical protein [Ignavibacteria bacterium]
FCGISTGTQRIEAENCGISQVQDIKREILNIYGDDIKKPAEQEISPSDHHTEGEPPINSKEPAPAGEIHPFICSWCETGISAEQRSSSVKEHKKAFCEKCIVAPPEPSKAKPKEEPAPKPEAVKEPVKEKEKKKTMVTEEAKTSVPAVQEKAQPPALKSDHEIDEMIERAKARKFAEGQGSSYKVSGKERPDSAMIQKIANECGISTEIILAEQTNTYSHVVTRGHLGNTYVDAVVHHDFATEFQLKTMEIIEKNPKILDHYEGTIPVIKEGATILKRTDRGDEQIDAKYYLVHALLSFKKFSLRDAATKSAAIVQLKLLNRDARAPEEVESELSERALAEESVKNAKAAGRQMK